MNMRLHINKRLAELLFFFLVLMMSANSQTDQEGEHMEVLANQKRMMRPPDVVNENPQGGAQDIRKTLSQNESKPQDTEDGLPFWPGFMDSLSMIFFVEFGDRTFMIVVLFTMKNDKCKVFFPAMITMAGLHLMSVAFGSVFPLLFSRETIVYFSIILFLFFGVMMLYETYYMESVTSEEKVQQLNESLMMSRKGSTADLEAISGTAGKGNSFEGHSATTPQGIHKSRNFCASPYLHLCVLLFLADWGDRCQISAIVLTATHNIWGVAFGGAIGMVICVCLAVLAGAFLANRLDERKTTAIAAVLFIIFALESLVMIE